MRKKKFFKRLLALVMALVLSNVVTTAGRAEAATCEHLVHYSTQVYARNLYSTHMIEISTTVYNTDGSVKDEKVEEIVCTVSQVQRYYENRCKSCNAYINTYDTISQEKHSYCH
ncbi:MAG: hypothetical protein IKL28_02675 [Lachnospiraceae bacterium]|nr:hypothetical protein [Lachnospiraceae bacterium]